MAYELIEKLNRGEVKATEPVQAANLWRLSAGSRLVWMGAKRPGYFQFDRDHGVLQLLDFCDNALVTAESPSMGTEAFIQFGALATRSPSQATGEMLGSAKRWIRQLGMPRVMAMDWTIG